jgi:hypothetical protein
VEHFIADLESQMLQNAKLVIVSEWYQYLDDETANQSCVKFIENKNQNLSHQISPPCFGVPARIVVVFNTISSDVPEGSSTTAPIPRRVLQTRLHTVKTESRRIDAACFF